MITKVTLGHDKESVVMAAKELLQAHGEDAEDVATEAMYEAIESEDVNKAAMWLAVISEIRTMSNISATIN